MLFGGMMVRRVEAEQLLSMNVWLGARLVARFLADRMRYRRGTRLVLGNALVGRLFKNLLDRKVPIWLSTRTERLVPEVVVQKNGERLHVRARKGVILAGGGFPANAELRKRYLPKPEAQHTPAGEGCVGDTLRLGQEAGGVLGAPGEDNALWFPSSIATRRDGSTAVYPHILLDRAKPGLIAVGASGKRFTDEAVSYHEFTRAMYRTGNVPAWLVCDRKFIWKYGLGMIRPMTPSLRRYLDSGYLREAHTLRIDAETLSETVRRHNEFARSGIDLDFGKGGNAYDRANGDPAHRPNPCLGVMEGSLYAIQVEPTPMGTSLGLRTNEHAQVCNAAGEAIPGLYAVGNDMQSVMGGEYPGPGTQLGPGMTFGYLAALHAVHKGEQDEPAQRKRTDEDADEKEGRRAHSRVPG
jgi:succinate dehydrogenase/fumarate reductase flavoprotein subunit